MILTQAIVKELLDYDPLTGILTWKHRSKKWFLSDQFWKSWNVKHAGKPALSYGNKKGRQSGGVLGKQYYAYHIIWLWMTGSWPDPGIDHEDQNPGNNRWVNLKEKTQAENCKNQSMRSHNTSGVTGVQLTPNGTYVAAITVNKKVIRLGFYKTIEQAAEVRRVAERNYGFSKRHGKPRSNGQVRL